MAFTELEKKRHTGVVTQFIEGRRPPVHIRDELDVGFRLKGQSVEIFEIRPEWDNPSEKYESPVAKATYVNTQRHWKVFWQRADLKWHGYGPARNVKTLEEFLALVDQDQFGCFWG